MQSYPLLQKESCNQLTTWLPWNEDKIIRLETCRTDHLELVPML
jgi:hypothetical protein